MAPLLLCDRQSFGQLPQTTMAAWAALCRHVKTNHCFTGQGVS